MSSRILVSGSRMGQDRQKISDELNRIGDEIGRLGDAMAMLADCWEGPAWNAFQNKVASEIEEMKEIYRFFDHYLEQSAAAEAIYQDCETANRRRMRKTKV